MLVGIAWGNSGFKGVRDVKKKKSPRKEKNRNNSILLLIILINSFMCVVKGADISLETEMTISQNILNFRFSASG